MHKLAILVPFKCVVKEIKVLKAYENYILDIFNRGWMENNINWTIRIMAAVAATLHQFLVFLKHGQFFGIVPVIINPFATIIPFLSPFFFTRTFCLILLHKRLFKCMIIKILHFYLQKKRWIDLFSIFA